jgi:hypothetical protein
MYRKMMMVGVAVATLSAGLDVTAGFARGGGHGGGGHAGTAFRLGRESTGAAMATQQRMIPLSTNPGPQISLSHSANPLSQSTLSSHPVMTGSGPAADGGHWQPNQSELPPSVRENEGKISVYQKAFDRALTICRGC